jgi:23S rRNA pseudouridine1911/1915/1917 synthase
MKYEVIHEDEHFLVVNKPSGLLSIPDRFGGKDSLAGMLQEKYGNVLTVHRLDRETSGILCFARTEAAHRHLSMQFEKHTADKFYLALIDGIIHHDEGEIDKPIAEDPNTAGKMKIHHAGKPSLTFYRTLERFKHYTLAEALIKTGRTHQIRVHFTSIGFPLAVDSIYGRKDKLFLSEIKGKKFKLGKFTDEERPILERTSLHSYRLRVDHPHTNERMTFQTELPKDLAATLSQLRKWGM